MTETQTPQKRRADFARLTVRNVRRVTDDAVEVTFEVPTELEDDFNYLPGQYVALRATIDGEELRRSYSLCDVPRRGEIKVAIKRTRGGRFSTWANEKLSVGDQMDVMNPQGGFTSRHRLTSLNSAQGVADEVAANPRLHLVAIAAGSGITPIIAIAQAVLSGAASSTFELIYANKSSGDVMFAEELGDLKDRYPTRFAVHHVLSREQRSNPLLSGRIDVEKLNTMLDHVVRTAHADEWFLCGPFELVQLCRDALAAREVPEEKVRFELFTTGTAPAGDGNHGAPVVVEEDGDNIVIDFTLDGTQAQVKSPRSAKETVLNAALRVRDDVPFACAGGVCGTCRARVIKGDFEMGENYALEKDEVDSGYVLTCQTRPCGDELVVDFDA
ncbi:1,2-phenylacetyl-CoA epoxidase subunit PaaE [Luteococcus sp. H138]|uniref:1,2-phenylacetyl-CoA epoxidase subunit PaaE n=1 Tax=unclassified Luteococcus TaxID=2639923 RepID=UPI00313E0479